MFGTRSTRFTVVGSERIEQSYHVEAEREKREWDVLVDFTL